MRRELWLVPLFLLVHNIEEALTAPGFLSTANRLAHKLLYGTLFPVTYSQLLFALVVVTILPFFLAVLAQAPATESIGRYSLLLIQAVVFLNVFSHVAIAFSLRAYTPGLVTAVCINLPFSVYLGCVAFRSSWLRLRGLLLLLVAALVIHGPVLFGLLLLARYVTRHF